MKTKRDHDEIWRDELKEYRGNYFVTYRPADSVLPFASVGLVFHEQKPSTDEIMRAMEDEMKGWLSRFRVPVMVSSYDATDSLIRLPLEGGSHLMAYVDPKTAAVVHRWGLFRNDEMPACQASPEHLAEVYRALPFRKAKDVREAAKLEHKKLSVGLRIFKAGFIFVAAVPVAIELVSLGIGWLSTALQVISLSTGFYKIAKASGWIKDSKSKKEKAEKQRKMEHYYYHCERNPAAFERLKIENFNRETEESTRKEAEKLRQERAVANPAVISTPTGVTA